MADFGARASIVRRYGVKVASVVVLALVAGCLIVYAVRAPGSPVHKADLNDGGVWVTDSKLGQLGRENKPIRQLDLALEAPRGPGGVDVFQSAQAVIAYDPGSRQLTPIDPSAGSLMPNATVQVPSSNVSLGGDVLAVSDTSGKIWATHVDTAGGVGSLDAINATASPKPLVNLRAKARVVVSQGGTTYAVSATKGTLTTLTSKDTSFKEPTSVPLDPRPTGEVTQVTTVGNRVVWLDAAGQLGSPGHAPISVGIGAQLQEPGPGAGYVLVDTPSKMLAVSLVNGSIHDWSAGASTGGTAAPPVRLNGCSWGLWSAGQVGTVVRACAGSPATTLRLGVAAGDVLVYRVNRQALLVNDLTNGAVWDVDGSSAEQVADWSDLGKKKKEQKQQHQQSVRSQEHAAPKANPDKLGVRSGATAVLHVLDNDSAPKHDILSITHLENPNKQISVQVAPDQESLLVDVDQGVSSGVLAFKYTVDDGEKTNATAKGDVELVVRGGTDNGHGKPRQRANFRATAPPPYPVAAGGSVDIPVLSDWRDAGYGDPIALVPGSAVASKGQTSITPDGLLRYVAPTGSSGAVSIRYRVTTGGASSLGKVRVGVFGGTKTAPPVAQPDVVAGAVGTPVIAHPLDNDVAGADPLDANARLALSGNVAPQSGLQVSTDVGSGTIRVTGSHSGSFNLDYGVTYGNGGGSSHSTVRVIVLPASESSNAPIPSPDSTVVHGSSPATVDVLANDYDQRGHLLAVTSAQPRNQDGLLDVSVVQGRWVRVSSRSGDLGTQPQIVDYTVSNGQAQATSTLAITQLPPIPPRDDVPDAQPDQVNVRAGGSVEIPVLDNDSTPSGDPVGLAVDTSVAVPGTLPMVDGPGSAYLDGRDVRYVAPMTVKGPVDAHLVYPVANQSVLNAPQSSGVVTVHVVPAPNKTSNPDRAPTPSELDARVVEGATITLRLPTTGQDPDGDQVVVTSVGDPDVPGGMPEKGLVTGFGADTITYEAFPGQAGADQFAYTVTDPFGRSAQGLARVTVVVPGSPQPPVAVDDSVMVDPARTLTYDVLGNDLFSQSQPPRVQPLRGAPEGITARDGIVTVKPRSSGGRTLVVPYADTDGLSSSSAQLTIRLRKGFDNPPVAGVVVAKPSESADVVTVNILKQVSDIDDAPTDLHLVNVDRSTGFAAPVIARGSVTLPVGALPHVWTYHVRDRKGAEAVGTVYVAARAPGVPYLRPGSIVHVKASESTTIDIAKYVVVPTAGGRPYLTTDDETGLSLHPSSLFAGDPTEPTQQKIRIEAGSSGGPGVVAFQVSTSRKLNDPHAVRAVIALPVIVTDTDHPLSDPRLKCPTTPIHISEVGQQSVDIGQLCNVWQDPSDKRSLEFTESLTDSVPGISVTGRGTTMHVTADLAKAGSRGTIRVGIAGFDVSSALPFVVTPLPPPTMTPIPDQTTTADHSVSVDLAAYLRSDSLPAADFQPRILSVKASDGGPAAKVSGTTVTVTPPPDEHNTYSYNVEMSDDGKSDGSRPSAKGRLRVVVTDVPSWLPGKNVPTIVRSVSLQSQQVTLTWQAPDDGGSPITRYEITGGGSSNCGTSTTCTVTGLTPGTAYSFRVVASNDVGPSKPSGAVTVTPDKSPTPVTSLRSIAESDGTITYQWGRPTGDFSPVTSYLVSRSDQSGYQTLTTSAATAAFTASGAANGVPLRVTVQAVDALGPSFASAAVSDDSGVASGRPQAPAITSITGTDVAGGTNKAFTVSWSQVAPNGRGAAEYQLTERGNPVNCDGGTWTGSQSCSVQVNSDGDSHTYAVTAANQAGIEPTALEGVATTHRSPTSAPQSVVAAGTPADFSSGPDLTATGNDGAARLDFTAGASHGASGTVTCIDSTVECSFAVGSDGGTVSHVFTGLSDGNTTTVKLQFCNGARADATTGTSPCVTSRAVSAQPYGPIRSASVNASLNDRTATVNGSADPNGRAITLSIERNGSVIKTCPNLGGSGTGTVSCGTTDGGLAYSTTYTYRLIASDASNAGRGSQTASTSVTTGPEPPPPPPPPGLQVSTGPNRVVGSGSGVCTTSGCPQVVSTTSNFSGMAACRISASQYGLSGFVNWSQGPNDTHTGPNVQQPGSWLEVTCRDGVGHSVTTRHVM